MCGVPAACALWHAGYVRLCAYALEGWRLPVPVCALAYVLEGVVSIGRVLTRGVCSMPGVYVSRCAWVCVP